MSRRPWKRCTRCGGICHWDGAAWWCDDHPDYPGGCGTEWTEANGPRAEAAR